MTIEMFFVVSRNRKKKNNQKNRRTKTFIKIRKLEQAEAMQVGLKEMYIFTRTWKPAANKLLNVNEEV